MRTGASRRFAVSQLSLERPRVAEAVPSVGWALGSRPLFSFFGARTAHAETRRVSEREPPSYTLVNGDQMGWWSSPGRPRMRGCVFFSSSSHLVQRERLREKNSIHSASQWLTQNLFFFTLTTTYSFFPLCYSFLAHWGLSLKSHIIIESLSNIYFYPFWCYEKISKLEFQYHKIEMRKTTTRSWLNQS